MTNEEMKALDGKIGSVDVMVISTGDALEQYQHEQWLEQGALRKCDRKWRVTHKLTWTWVCHYVRFGGGYWSLAQSNPEFIPVN